MTYHNANSLGAQSEEQAKKENWHRMDCLAKYNLKNERDYSKLIKWFAKQNEEWRQSRHKRFMARTNDRLRLYA